MSDPARVLGAAQARLEQRRAQARVAPLEPRRASRESSDEWREIDDAIRAADADAKRLPPHYRQTRLPDGAVVRATYIDVEVGNVGGREKWLARFRIVEGDLEGAVLLRAYNPPRPGWLSPQHALSLDFRAVTGLPPQPIPKRAPRAILGAFLKGVVVEARTALVMRRMDRKRREWVSTPEGHWYSVIDSLVGLVAGTPRILQGRRGRES